MTYLDVIKWWNLQRPKPVTDFLQKQASQLCGISLLDINSIFTEQKVYNYTGTTFAICRAVKLSALPATTQINEESIRYICQVMCDTITKDAIQYISRKILFPKRDILADASYLLLTTPHKYPCLDNDLCQVLINYMLMANGLPPFTTLGNEKRYSEALSCDDKELPIEHMIDFIQFATVTTWR